MTALFAAAKAGHVVIAERLIAAGSEVDLVSESGRSSSRRERLFGSHGVTSALPSTHRHIGSDTGHGGLPDRMTPLQIAAAFNRTEMTALLLAAGAAPDTATLDDGTALSIAAHAAHVEIVRLLLAAGADPLVQTSRGERPLRLIALKQHENAKRTSDALARYALNREFLVYGDLSLKRESLAAIALLLAGAERAAYEQQSVDRYMLSEDQSRVWTADSGEGVDSATKRTGLFQAAYFGRTADVEWQLTMLGATAFIDEKDEDSGLTPLSAAVQHGHTAVVKQLLAAGAAVNAADLFDNTTPLYVAARHGRLQLVALLLAHGADVSAATIQGRTPLSVAAARGHSRVVRVLLDAKADVNAQTSLSATPLFAAAMRGHATVVQVLLDFTTQACLVDLSEWKSGKTALFIAAENGHSAIVEMLLEAGADPDAIEARTHTSPLHIAAENDHVTVVRYLIKAGADVDRERIVDRTTALFIAAQNGHAVVVDALIAAGARVDKFATVDRRTALYAAAWAGHYDVVQIILAANPPPDVNRADTWSKAPALFAAAERGNTLTVAHLVAAAGVLVDHPRKTDGATPLLAAAREGNAEVCRLLIDAGADPNRVRSRKNKSDASENNASPLWIAADGGHTAIVEMLIAAGALADFVVETGATPLLAAAARGHTKIVKLLLAHSVDCEAALRSNFGAKTALGVAVQDGHLHVVELLLAHGCNVGGATVFSHSTPPALIVAAQNGFVAIVRALLIVDGISIPSQITRAVDGTTALHRAAGAGHIDTVLLLLENLQFHAGEDSQRDQNLQFHAGEDPQRDRNDVSARRRVAKLVSVQSANGSTALLLAAAGGHTAIASALITCGASVDLRGNDGSSPLYVAAHNGHTAIVELLLTAGAVYNDVLNRLLDAGESADKAGIAALNPLASAAEAGHVEIVRKLIAAGADVHRVSKHHVFTSSTPLISAVNGAGSTVIIVELLLNAGASVNTTLENGVSPLALAVARRKHAVVDLLLRCNAATDAADSDIGETPVMIAARLGDHRSIELLLNAGADVGIARSDGFTALLIAVSQGHTTVIKALLDYGVHVGERYFDDFTALHFAALSANPLVVAQLLELRAPIDATTTDGRTPLVALQNAMRADALLEGGQGYAAADALRQDETAQQHATRVVQREQLGRARSETEAMLISARRRAFLARQLRKPAIRFVGVTFFVFIAISMLIELFTYIWNRLVQCHDARRRAREKEEAAKFRRASQFHAVVAAAIHAARNAERAASISVMALSGDIQKTSARKRREREEELEQYGKLRAKLEATTKAHVEREREREAQRMKDVAELEEMRLILVSHDRREQRRRAVLQLDYNRQQQTQEELYEQAQRERARGALLAAELSAMRVVEEAREEKNRLRKERRARNAKRRTEGRRDSFSSTSSSETRIISSTSSDDDVESSDYRMDTQGPTSGEEQEGGYFDDFIVDLDFLDEDSPPRNRNLDMNTSLTSENLDLHFSEASVVESVGDIAMRSGAVTTSATPTPPNSPKGEADNFHQPRQTLRAFAIAQCVTPALPSFPYHCSS